MFLIPLIIPSWCLSDICNPQWYLWVFSLLFFYYPPWYFAGPFWYFWVSPLICPRLSSLIPPRTLDIKYLLWYLESPLWYLLSILPDIFISSPSEKCTPTGPNFTHLKYLEYQSTAKWWEGKVHVFACVHWRRKWGLGLSHPVKSVVEWEHTSAPPPTNQDKLSILVCLLCKKKW